MKITLSDSSPSDRDNANHTEMGQFSSHSSIWRISIRERRFSVDTAQLNNDIFALLNGIMFSINYGVESVAFIP